LVAKPTLLVVCVEINDPGNLGTIIRTADAAGADAVLVTTGSADVYNGKVLRSTAGSIFNLPVLQHLEAQETLTSLTSAGVTSFGLAGGGSTSLFDLTDAQLQQPTAWWLGSEAHGLPIEILAQTTSVSIPMLGSAESLNVATAGAVALFSSLRVRRFR
jgi:TrmH family RNA methyltransferase